tara:strand:+ start:19097 stop:19738 length:642 start_codon:yes stop_codon:yes gene_type:complete
VNYKDAHTHNLKSAHESIYIVPLDNVPSSLPTHFAMGIHPWYLDKTSLEQLEQIIQKYKPSILGECGLDKHCDASLEEQKLIFEKQLNLATEQQINKLVVHNVGHHNEIIKILKESSFSGKIMFHDYSGNQDQTEQYEKHFDSFYSLGARLFNTQTKLVQNIETLPLDKILLETDDQTHYKLDEIYSQAAKLLKIPLRELVEHVEQNFNAFIV